MNIYVSNLDTQLKNEDLKKLFTPHGDVQTAEIAIDAFTDQSRGFGYVEMPDEDQARKAIEALDNSDVSGQKITVQEAEPKTTPKGSYKVGNGAVTMYRFKKK